MARPVTWTTEKLDKLATQLEQYFVKAATDFEAKKSNMIPFLSRFCRDVGNLSQETLLTKAKENEALSEALKRAKEIQKEILIIGGLTHRFHPTAFIFTAKNITDMRDKQEVENRTEMHLTGFEQLKDEDLDAVIAKLKTQLGQGPGGESEANSGSAAPVHPAAPEAEGSEPV